MKQKEGIKYSEVYCGFTDQVHIITRLLVETKGSRKYIPRCAICCSPLQDGECIECGHTINR